MSVGTTQKSEVIKDIKELQKQNKKLKQIDLSISGVDRAKVEDLIQIQKMVNEVIEATADLFRKYEMCSECGNQLREFNEFDEFGNWESTTKECVECGNCKIIN